MNLRLKILLLLIIMAVGWQIPVNAQHQIQVVSRSIHREFAYTSNKMIQVNGEKAQVTVRPATTKLIRVMITLIAKNPSLKEAESDVRFCNYNIQESAGKIVISNIFQTKNGFKDITSNLSARIELEIPGNLILNIRNIYGTMDLKDVQATWNITNDFGQLHFQNITGSVQINSKYSDITGSQINVPTNIEAQKDEIKITDINKQLTIKNQYGNIELERIKAPINIEGEMTGIKITGLDFNVYSIDLIVIKGLLDVPREYQNLIQKIPTGLFLKTTRGTMPIKVKTSYNNITLN